MMIKLFTELSLQLVSGKATDVCFAYLLSINIEIMSQLVNNWTQTYLKLIYSTQHVLEIETKIHWFSLNFHL